MIDLKADFDNYIVRNGNEYVIAESCNGLPIGKALAKKWLDELEEHYNTPLIDKKRDNGDFNIYYEPNPIGVMTDMSGKKVPSSDPKYCQEYDRLKYGHSIQEVRNTYHGVDTQPRISKTMFITLPPSKLGYQMNIDLKRKDFIVLDDLLPTEW